MVSKKSQTIHVQEAGDYGSFSFSSRKRRSKTDWAGVGVGDAFKGNLDYFTRLPAQRLFYQACKKIQGAAARLTGAAPEPGFQPRTKPQLGPCYTSHPATLAAYAAIGLTGFLEFEARVSQMALLVHLAEYLQNPAAQDHVLVDPAVYKRLADIVARTVHTRLLLADLARAPHLSLVELYRLFSASQQNLKLDSVPAILNAVILYGDVLPDWGQQSLHPITRCLIEDVYWASRPFFDQIAEAEPHRLVPIGVAWVHALCKSLAKYLPPPGEEAGAPSPTPPGSDPNGGASPPFRFGKQPGKPPANDSIPPLDAPSPPALFQAPSAAERAAMCLLQGGAGPGAPKPGREPDAEAKEAAKTIQNFSSALDAAGGQEGKWEDMRSDLVERALAATGFRESPIQGNPTDGHEVRARLGKDDVAGGDIYDRPVELSDNLPAYEKLLAEAQPVIEALRRTLYPNIEQVPETERFRANGALDPGRLALAEFSSVVFKRHRIHERGDRRGQPVLLIACDGSGSLNRNQMRMLKVLTAAWLTSTVKSRVQVLAGLYHSGSIRDGMCGPLVQWMFHPRKTPAVSRRDAARALISLPDDGTGAQSDALSLAFMLDEALSIARGRMVYLIVLSDCAFNRSFNTSKSGKEEVQAFFESAYADHPRKLHTTLVALGVSGETGFETLLDKVITVPEAKLANYAAVAEQIGVYVASCMKERQRLVDKR